MIPSPFSVWRRKARFVPKMKWAATPVNGVCPRSRSRNIG
jgi:hypothetical protein